MISELLNDLKKFLEQILKNLQLPSGQAVNCYIGDIPKTRSGNEELREQPFAIIKPENGISDGQSTRMSVLIIVGTKAFDEESWKDTLLMAEKIAQSFAENHMINNKYELCEDVEWSFYESDSYPRFFAGIEASFDIIGVFNTYGTD